MVHPRSPILPLAILAALSVLPARAGADPTAGVWKIGERSFVMTPALGDGTFRLLEPHKPGTATGVGRWVADMVGIQFTIGWSDGKSSKATISGDQGALDGVAMTRVNPLDQASRLAGAWRTSAGSLVVIAPDLEGNLAGIDLGGAVADGIGTANMFGTTWTGSGSLVLDQLVIDVNGKLSYRVPTVYGPLQESTSWTWTAGRPDRPGRGRPDKVQQIAFKGPRGWDLVATFDPAGSRNIVLSNGTASQTMTASATWPAADTSVEGSWVTGLVGTQFQIRAVGHAVGPADMCTGTIAPDGATIRFDAGCGTPWKREQAWPTRPIASGNTIAGRWADGQGNVFVVPATTEAKFDVQRFSDGGRVMHTFAASWTTGLEGTQFVIHTAVGEWTYTFKASEPGRLLQHASNGAPDLVLTRTQ